MTGNPNDAATFIPLLQRGLSDARLLAGARAFAKRYQALDGAQQAERLAERLGRFSCVKRKAGPIRDLRDGTPRRFA